MQESLLLLSKSQLYFQLKNQDAFSITMNQIQNLSPEQRQAVMVQAQQEANAQIMRDMVNKMATACFQKCAGTSVSFKALNNNLRSPKLSHPFPFLFRVIDLTTESKDAWHLAKIDIWILERKCKKPCRRDKGHFNPQRFKTIWNFILFYFLFETDQEFCVSSTGNLALVLKSVH